MKTLSLKWIAERIEASFSSKFDSENTITGIAFDSRKVKKGDLFFALQGERDGHDYIEAAIAKGAEAVVISKDVAEDINKLVVEDTLFALGDLAKAYREMFDVMIIGITGSVGKTTTREMSRKVLEGSFQTISSPSNYNNLIGLPMTLFEIEEDTEIAICELGINQPGEMERLVEIANPQIGIITRIAPVHLEKLMTMENIAKEKVKLFKIVNDNDGACIYSLDDPLLDRMSEPYHGNRTTFGVKNDADFYADHIAISNDGQVKFKVDGNLVNLRIPGIHNVYNALAAYALARELGISGIEIAGRLSGYRGFANRLEKIEIANITFIDDCYNANPYSMKAGISTMISLQAERRVAIFADMLELGEKEIQFHEEIIEYALSAGLDKIFLYGELFDRAFKNIKTQREDSINETIIVSQQNAKKLQESIIEEIRPGDLVLFKGSRIMNLDKILKNIVDAKENK